MPNRGGSCCRPNARSCASRGCAPGHSRKARGERVRAGWRRPPFALCRPSSRRLEERADLLVELGTALKFGGDRARARVVLCEAIETARSTRNARAEWLARIELAEVNIHVDPPGAFRSRAAPRPRSMHSRTLADDAGLARLAVAGLCLRGRRVWREHGRGAPRARMRVAPGTSRQKAQASASLQRWNRAAILRRRCRSLRRILRGPANGATPASKVFLLARQGLLSARAGRFDQARATSKRRRAIAEEFGLDGVLPHSTWQEGIVEYLAGDFDSAETVARRL